MSMFKLVVYRQALFYDHASPVFVSLIFRIWHVIKGHPISGITLLDDDAFSGLRANACHVQRTEFARSPPRLALSNVTAK